MTRFTREQLDVIANSVLGELVPGGTPQNPYVATLTKNYKIGARMRTPDGLIWHYGQAGTIGVSAAMRRRAVASTIAGISITNFKTIGSIPVGATTFVINDTAVAHGADYWAGGIASLFPTAPDYSNDQPRAIKSSTASNGTSVTLTLFYPLGYAAVIPTNQDVYCNRSPYACFDMAPGLVAGTHSMIGYTWTPVLPHYFTWIQTWGLAQPVATGAGDMGITSGDRQVYFNMVDGTIMSGKAAAIVGLDTAHQRAGFIVPSTILAGGGDEPFIMLQLDP